VTEAWPSDFERLLRQAMAPVEPPERLSEHLENTLAELTDLAAEELEGWELSSMRDPRNWVRPMVAISVGATAGTALVVLRARSRARARRQHSPEGFDWAARFARDVAEETKKLFER